MDKPKRDKMAEYITQEERKGVDLATLDGLFYDSANQTLYRLKWNRRSKKLGLYITVGVRELGSVLDPQAEG